MLVLGPGPDAGWLQGAVDGAKGLVPETHLLPAAAQARVAARDYAALNPDELSFRAGELVGLLGPAPDPGWMRGVVNALGEPKEGLVPETHLAELPMAWRAAARRYQPQNADELPLQPGQEVQLLAPAADRGWFRARVEGLVGLVPETHLHAP